MKRKTIRILLISSGFILILLVGYRLYLEYQTDIQLFLNPKASKLLVFLTAIMCAVPGIPTSVIGVIAGLSFGPFSGTLINVLGNSLGNLVAIFLMHHIKFLDRKTETNHWVQSIRRMKHPKIGIMVGYMIPIIPSSVINFAADTMQLPLKNLIAAIFIGVIPSSILYACGGEALFHGYNKTAVLLIVSVLLFVGLVVIIEKDRKRFQKTVL
ncbi:MAG: VTT domain-containing protein [Enterococcus faecalis]|nr:VTT domain-containing protein [Enterococcus faecalis]